MFVDQFADFIDFLPRNVFVVQQMRNQLRCVSAEYTLYQVLGCTLFEILFFNQREENKRAAFRFMRNGTFFLETSQQGLNRAMSDRAWVPCLTLA